MRLGGPVFEDCSTPGAFVEAHRKAGFSAAFCPLPADAGDDTIRDFERAAKAANIVIAETGAWSNPLSPDAETRRKALDLCCAGLSLADRVGALCCVNISGSRGLQWDGPDPLNLTPETFDMIVETVRRIIDDVKPRRAFYALEPMPWMYPDSAESYLRLLEAVDRRQFAVHFDPVNIISSPERYFASGALIRDFFAKLGPHIKSCHGKDTLLSGKLTVHLDEVRPGLGALDYPTYLGEMAKLGPDLPLMVEHLHSAEEAALAAAHVRRVASDVGVMVVGLTSP